MPKMFRKELSDFIYNRVGMRLLSDKKGEDLQEILFIQIEEYKNREDLTDPKQFNDLYDTLIELISYHQRRSYKLGVFDGMNLFFVLDEESNELNNNF